MVESKDGRSRFIPYKPTVVRFSVDAFLLRGASNQVSNVHLAETFYSGTTICMQAHHTSTLPALHALQFVSGQHHGQPCSQVLQLRLQNKEVLLQSENI